jgi:DNA repair photolyase
MKKRFGQVASYDKWIEPYLVSNTLDILDREIPHLKSKIESVHLCFTTDPFMYGYDEIIKMSIASIKKLNNADIRCTMLTKGLLPEELSNFSTENEYGITIISLDENYRESIEPGAASYYERLSALRYLHDQGCRTWVSIEPYPTPNIIKQDLYELLETVDFVDKIVFGRTNYSKEISAYKKHRSFYNEQAAITIEFCEERDISYHIKEGTMVGSVALV